MRVAVDLHENLIQMPLPVRMRSHPTDSVSSDLNRGHQAKSVPPEPNCFVADVDATFVQKIFDVSQRQRKANIQHEGEADDLWAAVKVFERIFFNHEDRLRKRPARLNSNPSEKTLHIVCLPRQQHKARQIAERIHQRHNLSR